MEDNGICSEYSTSSGYVPPRKYAFSKDQKSLVIISDAQSVKAKGSSGLLSVCKQTLAEIFLPYGYPESVSDDYLAYQFWDTVQAFCSSLVGTLATHAVLTGLGVGSEDATPLAATLTWLTKDGLGMVGRITFVWYRGCDLDNDLKRWRFVADILNDAAFFVDMLSAAVPKFLFTPMVCFSSASRAIVGVAGGATRTALVQHQARRGNVADVSAKDGSQETIVNLSALIVSLLLVPAVEGKFLLIWFLYAVLTFLHLFSNYRAVKTLRLRTFNDKRLGLAVDGFLQRRIVPGIGEVNNDEPVVFVTNVFGCNLRMGVSLSEFFDCFSWRSDIWLKLQELFKNEQFIVFADSSKNIIRVVLTCQAEAKDIIFCSYLCYILSHSGIFKSGRYRLDDVEWSGDIGSLSKLYHEALSSRDEFVKRASGAGWSFADHNLTIAGQYRFEQGSKKIA